MYPSDRQYSVYTCLTQIKEAKFELNYNEKDGRISNPLSNLPSELRPHLKINNKPQQLIVDIRSCYPSLFGTYIMYIYNNICSPYPIPSISLHIVGVQCNQEGLAKEVEEWKSLFLSEHDPKDILSKCLNINREDIKNVIISYFNGSMATKNHKKFNDFIKTRFPLMYAVWMTTDKKTTGNQIGKLYESKIILNRRILTKSSELGVELLYEYDGYSLYCDKIEPCYQLLAFIEGISHEILGFALKFKNQKASTDIDTVKIIYRNHDKLLDREKSARNYRGVIISQNRWNEAAWAREDYESARRKRKEYECAYSDILAPKIQTALLNKKDKITTI